MSMTTELLYCSFDWQNQGIYVSLILDLFCCIVQVDSQRTRKTQVNW